MKDDIFRLCDQVRETAYAIHEYLGHGHLEKVYENALAHRLAKAGIRATAQAPLQIKDEDGFLLGDYVADLIVENRLIVEVKAAKDLCQEHYAQVLGYLRGTGLEHGLLVNFGSYKFQIKKVILQTALSPAKVQKPLRSLRSFAAE
jgi:GxxExxY protein